MEVNAPEVTRLEELGIVRVRGVDAARFLQGQLSNDVTRLSADRSLLAGYHNPQGRVIALLRLVQWDADDILAVVPRELAGVVAGKLAKFILRAKVKVSDQSSMWRVRGLVGVAPAGNARAALPAELPAVIGAQTRGETGVFVRVDDAGPRWLVVAPQGEGADVDGSAAGVDATDVAGRSGYVTGDRLTWNRLDVAAGQPQVLASTTEEFVAQMLNLDVLNAIAFDKGCYTGQEVIARAHYRGRVKRRMQRFVSREACRLVAGDSGQLADGRSFKVVLAAQLTDGRCEFLAVAPMVGAEREDAVAGAAVTAPASAAAAAPAVAAAASTAAAQAAAPAVAPTTTAATPTTLIADQLPLPYALPD